MPVLSLFAPIPFPPLICVAVGLTLQVQTSQCCHLGSDTGRRLGEARIIFFCLPVDGVSDNVCGSCGSSFCRVTLTPWLW